MKGKYIAVILILIAGLIWLFQGVSSPFYDKSGGLIVKAEKIECDMIIDVDSIINPRCVNTHNSCLSFNTAPFSIFYSEVTVVISDGQKTESEPYKVSSLGKNKDIKMTLCSKSNPQSVSIKLLRNGVVEDSTQAVVG